MDNFYIKPNQLKILTEIFSKYCPNAEIWAYGSRVNGSAHEGSDLDLVIKSFNSDNCSISELRQFIQNYDIPFLVDLNLFESMPKSFQDEILKRFLVIWGK